MAITHENLIASILQASEFLETTRETSPEIALGCLPFSHIYGLWTAHLLMYLGDSIIIHRGFNFMEIMASIAKYRIGTLYLVVSCPAHRDIWNARLMEAGTAYYQRSVAKWIYVGSIQLELRSLDRVGRRTSE